LRRDWAQANRQTAIVPEAFLGGGGLFKHFIELLEAPFGNLIGSTYRGSLFGEKEHN
jgi:hypothetical protein